MSCPAYKQLCDHLVISTAVTFADDTLTINIPQDSYRNCEKYCIVVAQTIPEETTITAPVVITIGTDTTTTYPLLYCDCTPVTACSINTRTRYSTKVRTSVDGGAFVMLKKLPCSRCTTQPSALPITPAADVGGAATPAVANITPIPAFTPANIQAQNTPTNTKNNKGGNQ